ncbi:UGSC family (seleno)protein [Saccharopolyspora sp. 5N708]|uniref:UGSC family (seleno)protein n=1 Tax=Saccharopolyspora sp. 5N708 TaxID=3457424 RepID=UPI003FD3B197
MFEAMIDPTARPAASSESGVRAPRPAELSGLTVGLLANTKKNAEQFLDAVAELLAAQHGTAGVVRRKKLNIAEAAPAPMLAELVDSCDVIVVGVGDCGSCSASAVVDGLAAEAAGRPAVVICSDAFRLSADAMAQAQGEPGYTYLTTPHPVAPLVADEVDQRAQAILPGIVGMLTTPSNATVVA